MPASADGGGEDGLEEALEPGFGAVEGVDFGKPGKLAGCKWVGVRARKGAVDIERGER